MCTEGFLNTKPRVPTEYGFVRDRGVPKSFSLTVCMLKLRMHCAKDVCKVLHLVNLRIHCAKGRMQKVVFF